MKRSSKELALLAGENVRRERLRRDISQEQLAKQTGRTAQYISLLENGDRCGSVATYLKIANELGLSLNELFSDSKADSGGLDLERGILKLFRGCSPYELHVMTSVVSATKTAMRSGL